MIADERRNIENLIMRNEEKKAWEATLEYVQKYDPTGKYRTEAIMQLSNANELADQRRRGLLSLEQVQMQRSRLMQAMLDLLDLIDSLVQESARMESFQPATPANLPAQPASGWQVLVSYGWEPESESICEAFEKCAPQDLTVIRDKTNGVGYKGDIGKFEERISRSNAILIVLSDKYWRSEDCMKELLLTRENNDLDKAAYPVILNMGQLRDQRQQMDYYQYWDKKCKDQNQLIQTAADMTYMDEPIKKLKFYNKVKEQVVQLINYFINLNVLTPDYHRQECFRTIIGKIKESRQPPSR